MGVRIATIGHIDVRPSLNDEEYSYLMAFTESRRWRRPQGALWVPSTPFGLDEEGPAELDDYNNPPDGQPDLWCPWRPSCEGACLVVDDPEDKPRQLVRWLGYLVDTFLVEGALATGQPGFDGFSFDHQVSGVVATHHAGSGELALIRVTAGVVTEESHREPDPNWWAA